MKRTPAKRELPTPEARLERFLPELLQDDEHARFRAALELSRLGEPALDLARERLLGLLIRRAGLRWRPVPRANPQGGDVSL